LRAAVELANQIGMDRIEHRQMADYLLQEMKKRGAESWTSPDPALRCAIATVNVPPIVRMDLEKWLWTTKKIRIRGGEPSKLRLSTPYDLLRKDVDRFLTAFDEYRKAHAARVGQFPVSVCQGISPAVSLLRYFRAVDSPVASLPVYLPIASS
jgi:isopenicillin-N epimerase